VRLETSNANLSIKLNDSEKQNDSLRDQIGSLNEKQRKLENEIQSYEHNLDSKNNEVKIDYLINIILKCS
jgi:uncharacterized coiled-coil DUF342 family protein